VDAGRGQEILGRAFGVQHPDSAAATRARRKVRFPGSGLTRDNEHRASLKLIKALEHGVGLLWIECISRDEA
jgi:hypothetical protein